MKTFKLLCFAILLWWLGGCAKVSGQQTALEIDGPQKAVPGQLERLTARTGVGETPFWIVLSPVDLDYEQIDGGKRLVFAAGCGAKQTISILLLAQQMEAQRIVTRQTRWQIELAGSIDTPPPPQSPPANPDPTPVNESPLFQATLTAWPRIKTDAAKALSPEIAANFERVAAEIAKGQISDSAQIWSTISQANRATLEIETAAWTPVAATIQTEFQRMSLASASDHGLHLRAIAAAIKQAFSASQRTFNMKAINQ